MQVGWQRPTSAHLDGVLHVDVYELTTITTVADLKALLLHQLHAADVAAHDPVLELLNYALGDGDELAPYGPTLDDGGLRWMLRFADVATNDGRVPVFFEVLPWRRTFELYLALDTMYTAVLEALTIRTNVAVPELRLFYAGTRMMHNATLASYGVEALSCIRVMFAQYGGGGPAAKFADVSNTDALHSMRFSSQAPRWREVHRGLNIHGTCLYTKCQAFGQEVIAPQRFKPFNVVFHTAMCPVCHAQFETQFCSFLRCTWRFLGQKAETSLALSSLWKTLPSKDEYHAFDSDESTLVLWRSLMLFARLSKKKPTCALCHGHLAPRARTSCGHAHRACATTWAASSARATCPECRTSLA